MARNRREARKLELPGHAAVGSKLSDGLIYTGTGNFLRCKGFHLFTMTTTSSLFSSCQRAFVAGCLLTLPALSQEPEKRPASDSNPPVQFQRWLTQMDTDKDGQLAKEEATGLMLRYFDRNDSNEDGILDQGELKAVARRLAERDRRDADSDGRRVPAVPTERMLASAPEGITILPDLAYREGESASWKLDLVMPEKKSADLRPGIVFVHGGGWRNGDKRSGTFLRGAIEYAQKGYVCITVNYRLTGEAPFPACIEDVKCAVRWFRAHAEEYGLDPNRIGGYGNSAGAHLVSMLGLAGPEAELEGDGPHQDQSSLLQAVCASATPTDFSLFRTDFENDPKFRHAEDPAGLARNSAPMTHVKAGAPPFLLVHGTADKTVNVKHSDRFAKALEKAGAEDVTYLRIDGSGHGVFNEHRKETAPAMESFFARTLGGP